MNKNQNATDVVFNENEWAILRYLYHRDNVTSIDDNDIDIIAHGLNVEKPLAVLTVAKLYNEGWVSRVFDQNLKERYVLSLEGFDMMKARKLH